MLELFSFLLSSNSFLANNSFLYSLFFPLPSSELEWYYNTMTSLHQHRSNYDRVFAGNIYSETRRRGSTSQMRLQKILTLIATVPPPLAPESPLYFSSKAKESSSEFGFDLNVEFHVSSETKEFIGAGASGLSSTSATVGYGGVSAASGDGRLENGGGDRVEIIEEHGNGVVLENPESTETKKTDERLSLLIEAAKMILGESKNQDDNVSLGYEVKKGELAAEIETNERKLRRRSSGSVAPEMEGEIEETTSSQVVRTKRGRTQVLPCKYRDSVLEPLTRLSKQRRR